MKILIVKLSSLGDVIQTMPVVHDLHAAFPGAQIDWVVEEAFAPLVARVAGLDRVLPLGERRWRKSRFSVATRRERADFFAQLQSKTYDAVVDFQGLIKSALVARQAKLARGGFRATYANGSDACSYEWPVRWLLDRLVPMPQRIHAVARYRRLAAGALRYALPESPPTYGWLQPPHPVQALDENAAPTPPDGRVVRIGTVVLAHGTTRPDNEWPADRWIDLGHRLAAKGYRVVLPQAGAQELALASGLADAIGPQASVWPALSLAQVLDRMASTAGVAGVIGVDSGLSHLAVALDLPHVQIFSQPRAWRAGPVGHAHQVAVGGDAAPDVDTVWRAWMGVIAAAAPAAVAPPNSVPST